MLPIYAEIEKKKEICDFFMFERNYLSYERDFLDNIDSEYCEKCTV